MPKKPEFAVWIHGRHVANVKKALQSGEAQGTPDWACCFDLSWLAVVA
jgi:hypothetical protein